jgi:hypothetical protein
VGIPFTDVPAYIALPLLTPTVISPLLPFDYAWLITFLIGIVMSTLLWRLHARGRTPGWMVRRMNSWLRRGIYHARPLWYVRRMSRITSPDDAVKYAMSISVGYGEPEEAPVEPKRAAARKREPDAKKSAKHPTDKFTRKKSQ